MKNMRFWAKGEILGENSILGGKNTKKKGKNRGKMGVKSRDILEDQLIQKRSVWGEKQGVWGKNCKKMAFWGKNAKKW